MFEIADLNNSPNGLNMFFELLLFGLFCAIGIMLINYYCKIFNIADYFNNKKMNKYALLNLKVIVFIFIFSVNIYLFYLFFSYDSNEPVRQEYSYSKQLILQENNQYLFDKKDNNKMYCFYYQVGNQIKVQNVGKSQINFYVLKDGEKPKAIWYKEYCGNWLFYYYKHTCDIYLPQEYIPKQVNYNLG